MGGDDWILLPRVCLSGWSRSASRLGTSEFSSVGSQIAGGSENVVGSSSH